MGAFSFWRNKMTEVFAKVEYPQTVVKPVHQIQTK